MHTLEFPQKQLIYSIPSDWDECSDEQVHFILKAAFEVMEGIISMAQFRIKVFKYFTGLKLGLRYLIRQKLGLNQKINETIFHCSQELCDWIFVKKDEDNYELNYETIINYFKTIGEYYGPEDLLADLTLSEFKTALNFLNQYFDFKENEEDAETYLNYFMATIYRPKNHIEQKVSFHGYILEPEHFKSTPLWIKQVIAIWFSYCVKCLKEEDLIIDGLEINLSSLFPEPSEKINNRKINFGWTGVMLEIAESGVFGNSEQTGKTLLYDILLYLLKNHQDQAKQK